MKLLVCTDTHQQLNSFFTPLQGEKCLEYLFHYSVNGHEIWWLQTGHYAPETYMRIQSLLSRDRFHLALKFSSGLAIDPSLQDGTIVNIINEIDPERGINGPEGWQDYYSCGWLNREDHPHIRGGWINMTNAYLDVFLPYRKVVGISPTTLHDIKKGQEWLSRWRVAVETTNGLPFSYSCLWNKQSFYHLAIIGNNRSFIEEKKTSDFSELFHQIISLL